MRPGVDKSDAPGPVALCFDMLAPEGYGEIIGGSQRDTDLEALKRGLLKEGEAVIIRETRPLSRHKSFVAARLKL